jgi:predicted nuclease of predicted toxin-antitoxin system
MRFKIDENLPDALVALLSSAGHEATTTREEGLNGRPDAEVAGRCMAERKAVITLDTDFSDITAYPPEAYAGIIVLRLRDQQRDRVLHAFRRVLPLLETEPLDAHLWIVEETRIRIWNRW